jgi:hypothetical protein
MTGTEDRGFEREMRDRLDRLERQLRLWRRGALAASGLAALALAGAMASPEAKELAVTKLRVVDDSGKDRIVLSANPTEADLTFFDPSGKSRLTLDVAKDRRPILQFSDEANKESSRLTLGLEDEGHPALMLFDGQGRKRVAFGIPKNGGPVIRILDENEKLQMRFP